MIWMASGSRLVLGTAQFGMQYGIANTAGRPDGATAEAIVSEAFNSGIRMFDTAQAYGESEKVLGETIKRLRLKEKVCVISKLHPSLDLYRYNKVHDAMTNSLRRLGVKELGGLMLHKEDFLNEWDAGVGENLLNLKSRGLVRHIGVSVYSPRKALRALGTDGIDMIQIPSNIFDRRFEKAGVFETAERTGKAVFVRSVYLQGLMFLKLESLPDRLRFATPILRSLYELVAESGLTPQELALGYVRCAYPGAFILFGAETVAQVQENVKCWDMDFPVKFVSQIRKRFCDVGETVLNPSLWEGQNN